MPPPPRNVNAIVCMPILASACRPEPHLTGHGLGCSGANGTVLLAEHKLTGERVAIKMVPRGWGSQAQLCSRWAALRLRAALLATQPCRRHAELLLCGTGQELQLSGRRNPHGRLCRHLLRGHGVDVPAPSDGLCPVAAAPKRSCGGLVSVLAQQGFMSWCLFVVSGSC